MLWLLILGASIATVLGGLLALRLVDRLHLILGFSAGTIVALALLELIPKAIEFGEGSIDEHGILAFVAFGFFAYAILDRMVSLHAHTCGDECEQHARSGLGSTGAVALAGHSVIDGFAIAVAFLANPALGLLVAIAIIVHDFSDGINTVNLVIRNGGTRKQALTWLGIDAIAPIVGVAAALLIAIPEQAFAPILAIFAGLFLYIGASDLLPESHHRHPKALTTVLTIAGALLMFAVVALSH